MRGKLPNVLAVVLKTCLAVLLLAPLSSVLAQTSARQPGARKTPPPSPQPGDAAQTSGTRTETQTPPNQPATQT